MQIKLLLAVTLASCAIGATLGSALLERQASCPASALQVCERSGNAARCCPSCVYSLSPGQTCPGTSQPTVLRMGVLWRGSQRFTLVIKDSYQHKP
ncbi:uncharacterized protein BCR38DRAFT_474822 [Pseudomassariella vexata]|uniref:Uncharacterized protein n=1 Tax=Pseudomassariella vexata TaxID=1141098 RepID=A0A1Y2DYI6_9PEZI|nr:uncharacterized protein BCR38DRAFT_474822 [Pseudomassariella vexata]ORY64331.1 hypothetical protein BCR38DRAFT_474822 [Pseudomassariella vexata]